ncbi:MAG: GNAT family N-acetyltransferase [Anaerolineaceae bacterium]|nr:GNAT family N-acetyltransferase [Anaerolineaceae bacterium]
MEPLQLPSEEEINADYDQGKEAVVTARLLWKVLPLSKKRGKPKQRLAKNLIDHFQLRKRETQPLSFLPFASQYESSCAGLIAALPDWFGIPEANAAYLRDLALLPAWVALSGDRLVGAAALAAHFPGAFEIHFLAVHPDCHRRGIGRGLVELLEGEARQRGGRWIHVKTLGPSHPDPFYARTRAFYAALGYEPLFESSAIWGPENPAVVLIKFLC